MWMRPSRGRIGVLLAVVAVLLSTRPGETATKPAATKKKTPCCFTNVLYSGVCQVERAPNETCASILAYLNKPMTTGKTYCKNTTIRARWREKRCEP